MGSVDNMFSTSIRKYGLNTIVKGVALQKDYPRLPSGIFALDHMIAGGIPAGVASCLYGPPGGGKSLLMLKVIASAQKLCFECFDYEWDCKCKDGPKKQKVVLVSPEIVDMEWAKCLGVDEDQLYVVEPEYGEQGCDIISESLAASDCGLVCLDSLAMLTPLAEVEASFEDANIALQARLISRLMRVVGTRLIRERKKGHRVTFLATNHIRSKIGQVWGNPEDVPGGWAAKHTWHLTLRLSQLKSESIDKEMETPINAKFKASTVAMNNKKKIFMLRGSAEYYCTMQDSGEFVVGDIPDFKTVEKFADEIEFISRNPWSILDKKYDKKADLINDWQERDWYLSVKKKLVDEYVGMAKMEKGL